MERQTPIPTPADRDEMLPRGRRAQTVMDRTRRLASRLRLRIMRSPSRGRNIPVAPPLDAAMLARTPLEHFLLDD